jgi:hypothetical protein
VACDPACQPADQKIIKTEISVEVPDVPKVRVRAMAVELGGYVGGSQAGTRTSRDVDPAHPGRSVR